MLLQGCRRGAPGGDPPGATAATGVHLSDQRAHAGGSSSLGMSPEKKSLIFLPMSPIGLSSAWLWGEGVVGRESPAVSCNITRRRRWSVGTAGVEELQRTSEERDGHAQWGHDG